MVWFRPPYLAYRMPGIVRTIDGRRGVWVNFFGDGQTHFTPQEGREERFASWVESVPADRRLAARHASEMTDAQWHRPLVRLGQSVCGRPVPMQR